MSTTVATTMATPMSSTKFTVEQVAEINDQVQKSIGPALTEALKPLTEKQANLMQEMLDAHDRTEKREKPDAEKGLMFARHARAMALGKGDPERAKFEVKRFWGDDDPVLKGLDGTIRLKSLQAGVPASAGNIVIPEWSREWIELLRNSTVIASICRTLPMTSGTMTMRKQTAAGVAYYVGEGVNITKSEQAVGLFTLSQKKLAALTPVSNDLLRFSGSEADAFVRDDLLLVAAIRKDLALLRGDGTEYTPRGIENQIDASHKFNQTAATLAGYDGDLSRAVRQLQEANIPLTTGNGYWIMAPRTAWGLYKLAAGTDTGVRPYRTAVENGTLLGYKVLVTNQVPINLSGTQSKVYFVHGPSCILASTLNVQVDIFNGGAYHDGVAVVSGISTDETVVRVIEEHDFGMRYDRAGSQIDAVTLS